MLCYDANASPVRAVQRSGRTGRTRPGRVVHLLAAGKEEQQFARQEAVRARFPALLLSGNCKNTHFLDDIVQPCH